MGVAVDANDMVYVTEHNSHVASVFNSQGKCMALFGKKGLGRGQFESDFNGPTGVAVDSGVVYVCDQFNHRVLLY